jgi:hypothetical protein
MGGVIVSNSSYRCDWGDEKSPRQPRTVTPPPPSLFHRSKTDLLLFIYLLLLLF